MMKTDLRPSPRNEPPLGDRSKATQTTRPAPPDAPETASIHQTITPEQAAAVAAAAQSRKITPAEFNAAMVHFYRGEVSRANTWRNRLDTTTNWAVLTTGATLSFAFSSPTNPHFVILINTVLVTFFLFMEARRYRYYEIWSSRVRILETGFITQMLCRTRRPTTRGASSWLTTSRRRTSPSASGRPSGAGSGGTTCGSSSCWRRVGT